jgi:hypothetical protein
MAEVFGRDGEGGVKTYGKYTDCNGVEQSIDEFHMHELIDRLHITLVMFEESVVNHPASVLVSGDVQAISSAIGQLYQKVGRIEYGGMG